MLAGHSLNYSATSGQTAGNSFSLLFFLFLFVFICGQLPLWQANVNFLARFLFSCPSPMVVSMSFGALDLGARVIKNQQTSRSCLFSCWHSTIGGIWHVLVIWKSNFPISAQWFLLINHYADMCMYNVHIYV